MESILSIGYNRKINFINNTNRMQMVRSFIFCDVFGLVKPTPNKVHSLQLELISNQEKLEEALLELKQRNRDIALVSS